MDLARATIKAFKNIYFFCYFHFIARVILHLPQLKSKKSRIKNIAQNILYNIKLLCFIEMEKIEEFYNRIEERYNNKTFTKFFEYFSDTHINDLSFYNRK